MKNIFLYYIKDGYINYLRNFDNKVLLNKKETRPYVGIVLEVKKDDGLNHKYFVPLSSPKTKHETMKNTKDFRKLGNGRMGALNFNNMLPVPDEQLLFFDINKVQDEKYRSLLRKQVRFLREMGEDLSRMAQTIYKLRTSEFQSLSKNDKKIYGRCCDFSLLEQMAIQYQDAEAARQEVAATMENKE